ncbi:Fe-S cluster assembly sulfur transfer protein SufU [Fructilactobacillus frigidiflavus]|uniref:Fe-S cluster assembly sulfur transfer protein SufU n=1 Tax=Fructilactobacillus frigidiflavus TaxID=3242688 RepID=UPI0037576D39
MGLRDMSQLYKQVVLDHAKYPRNFGEVDHATETETLRNPSCGDEITVALTVQDDLITDIHFHGIGCTISKASTSMMTLALTGKTLPEAQKLIKAFQNNVINKAISPAEQAELGDASLLSTVAQFPTRVRCATLGWHVSENIINELKGAE